MKIFFGDAPMDLDDVARLPVLDRSEPSVKVERPQEQASTEDPFLAGMTKRKRKK
jgi:hypothetical protein